MTYSSQLELGTPRRWRLDLAHLYNPHVLYIVGVQLILSYDLGHITQSFLLKNFELSPS